MTGQMNGKDAAVAQGEAPDQSTVAARGKAALDVQVGPILGTMIRGLLVSAQGIPAHMILESIARVTGGLLADSIAGDLGPVLKLRAGFKEAFDEGVRSSKPKTM